MSANSPATTVVIVTFNSRYTIGETLALLHPAFLTGDITCVLVDNASTDGTGDFVASHYPWVRLICSPHNIGYGRGCNLGLHGARTKYVLILNPDAAITPDALQMLVDFMDSHHRAGIAAPAIIEGANRLQAAGMMTTPGSLLRSAFGLTVIMPNQKPIKPGDPAFRTPWVCGAIMLVRTELFEKLRGFDPRFFLYFEETDLCRRASEAGTEIWAVGKAVARHVGGASTKTTGKRMQSGCITEHYYRSRFYYLVKHFGWVQAVGAEILLRLSLLVRGFKQRIIDNKASLRFTDKAGPFRQSPDKPNHNQ